MEYWQHWTINRLMIFAPLFFIEFPIEPPTVPRKSTKESATASTEIATSLGTTTANFTGAENSTLARLPQTTNLSSIATDIVPILQKPDVASEEKTTTDVGSEDKTKSKVRSSNSFTQYTI
jgi:hypothetical protein